MLVFEMKNVAMKRLSSPFVSVPEITRPGLRDRIFQARLSTKFIVLR